MSSIRNENVITPPERFYNVDLLQIWKIESRELLKLLSQHRARICALDFSSDGRFLVSAGGGIDRKVRIWDMETYRDNVLPIGVKFTLAVCS